jgi:hypothetical protein
VRELKTLLDGYTVSGTGGTASRSSNSDPSPTVSDGGTLE